MFTVQNFGQIKEAKIDFGDLTILIGPQASGKSILLQLFKLVNDYAPIARLLKKYGFDWHNNTNDFLTLFFGENLSSLWNKRTIVNFNKKRFDVNEARMSKQKEKVFYIPAQRVITLGDGWSKPFMSFRTGDPFIIKNFSEHLRLLMEAGLGRSIIFPQDYRMKKVYRDHINSTIFHDATVELETASNQRRIVLNVENNKLPYMSWSAGQREFLPLMLGLYWLMPSSANTKKGSINWVIIEEPEMGLHPRAILSFLLTTMELIKRGYKVIISTHSATILTAIWAIQEMKANNGKAKHLAELFELKKTVPKTVFDIVLKEKKIKSYYFKLPTNSKDKKITIQDISSLNPGDQDEAVADWGGLTELSSLANEIVCRLDRD